MSRKVQSQLNLEHLKKGTTSSLSYDLWPGVVLTERLNTGEKYYDLACWHEFVCILVIKLLGVVNVLLLQSVSFVMTLEAYFVHTPLTYPPEL